MTVTDRQTDRQSDGHVATAHITLCIASLGKMSEKSRSCDTFFLQGKWLS